MGQKVSPYGLRIGINKTWKSKWYVSSKDYADHLHEDLNLRRFVETNPITKGADIADVEIIRRPQKITLVLHTARPGVVIGSKGANIEKLGADLYKKIGKKVQIKIKEIKRFETSASAMSINIAKQLKNRASFRRTLKVAISSVMKAGAQGVKVRISGRLGGAEMARVVMMKEGRVPLHTLRASIDYGFSIAQTTFGSIGVKVWIFNGEILKRERKERTFDNRLIKNNSRLKDA